MQYCAELFVVLADGYAATFKTRASLKRFWEIPRFRRFFELIGFATKSASQSQFSHGCGWRRNFQLHYNFTPKGFGGVHGCGFMHWHRYQGGRSSHVDVSMAGHADANNTRFTKSKEEDLNSTYSLTQICEDLGIEELL
jgi:hypothetical protein